MTPYAIACYILINWPFAFICDEYRWNKFNSAKIVRDETGSPIDSIEDVRLALKSIIESQSGDPHSKETMLFVAREAMRKL